MMSWAMENLGTSAAVVCFGGTTLVLLATTWYLKRSAKEREEEKSNEAAGKDPAKAAVELDRSKYPGGHLAVYFGSQTGTAEMFAKQIAKEGAAQGFCVRVVDLQDLVENEDASAAGRAKEGDFGDLDDDAALIRATLADPAFRDPGGAKQRSKALFFMATYGEGEPTDNALQFTDMMKRKAGISNIYNLDRLEPIDRRLQLTRMESTMYIANGLTNTNTNGLTNTNTNGNTNGEADIAAYVNTSFLSDLDYAVFGLGNKQYEHYNNMGRFVDVALEQCGATRIAPLGLGDDDDDLEGDFETWKDTVLWPALKRQYVRTDAWEETKADNHSEDLPSCPFQIQLLDAASDTDNVNEEMMHTSSKHYFRAVDCPITERRELRDPSDPGSTIHMEIAISPPLTYLTADNLGILPKNSPAVVESVATALGFNLDQTFRLIPNETTKHTLPFPMPCTVRQCLERYCDLTGSPRRSDLKQLAAYARDELDRKALLRMSSKEGKAEYRSKIVDSHVGIADIVCRLCPSIVCPLEHFLNVCPRLQPRYYTISSSSTCFPDSIHITFSVLETTKSDGGVYRGLCSGYLADLSKGDKIRVFVRDSTFRLPKESNRPVIMIGPGTGIAPMRAILQERSHARKNSAVPKLTSESEHKTEQLVQTESSPTHGPNILYFGCKHPAQDYLYQNELQSYLDEGTLAQLHVAFSRQQSHKVYVQHLLAKHAAETWKHIHEGKASIFVCGGIKMGADVDHVLQDIVAEQGGMSKEESKSYLDRMALKGRFVQELWA